MKVIHDSYREEFGEGFVGMSKETASKIILEFSDYENKEKVVEEIMRSHSPPYIFVPPYFYTKYIHSLNPSHAKTLLEGNTKVKRLL